MTIVSCGDRALPRDLDVDVQIDKPQTELTTDLSVLVALVNDAPFDPDAGRIRYYSTLASVLDDFSTTDEAYLMAVAFFSQAPRATTMAIGKVFTAATAGFMEGNAITADITDFQAVSDGEFEITIDGQTEDIALLDFSLVNDFDDVAVVVEAGLQAIGSGGYTAATATIDSDQILRITSGTTGASSTVTFLSTIAVPAGTDISGSSYLNADATSGGKTVDGYVPGDLTSEAALVQEAARCAGRPVYGWTVEKAYRDDSEAEDLAQNFIEAQSLAILGLQSNNAQAVDAGVTNDIGSVLKAAGLRRTYIVWDDKEDEYPEVAILAYMLHVDYLQANSTVTAKFKNLNGITPVGIQETELNVLNDKRYNTFTRVGNNSRTYREGVESSPIWYMDSLINLDNFKEQLQVNLYNVFLREKKVPYTPDGQNLLYDGAYDICVIFVDNLTFADREELDSTTKSGTRTIPAFEILLQPLAQVTAAQRAARIGTPMTINAYEAGAMHSLQVNVNAFT